MSNSDISHKQLGERIRKARIKLNLSQDDLAKKVGYSSRTSIAKVEKGDVNISHSKIMSLASALHMTTSDLMGWDPDELFHKMNSSKEDTIARTIHLSLENLDNLFKISTDDLYEIISEFYVDDMCEILAFIKKYCSLDQYSRNLINTILDNEYKRYIEKSDINEKDPE